MTWLKAAKLSELEKRGGRMVVRPASRPLALFATPRGIAACANRCPHEGYPLVEGSLDASGGSCVLTCNWHNWKFDVESGETLVGGDALETYRTRVQAGWIELDWVEPAPAERQAKAKQGIAKALGNNDYDRLARETARLEKAGGAPLDALRLACDWARDRLEYGMRHALGAAPDWLQLREATAAADAKLVALLEILGHVAADCEGSGAAHAFTERRARWDEAKLLAAIEAEDEDAAAAILRGGLAAGIAFADLFHALGRAALAHYQNFGHALIYVRASERLLAQLGHASAESVLLPLLRSLVYARREDLLPEFRDYAAALAGWGKRAEPAGDVALEPLIGAGVAAAIETARAWSGAHPPDAIYAALLAANGWNLLHFDASLQERYDQPLGENAGWLDVTHGVTFARAVGETCRRWPELWPQGLLQMACFAGRNAGFTKRDETALQRWAVPDAARFAAETSERLFDHGRARFITSAHLVKTFCAAVAEAGRVASAAPLLLAGANRFLNSPIKGRHVRRTARQALGFVAIE